MKLIISRSDRVQEVSIPKHYRHSYPMFELDADVYYPTLIHLIARYWIEWYWKFVRSFWQLGLIDTKIGERFRWSDFYRMKSH